MTKIEKLRFYADVLEKPYMDCERSIAYPNGRMRPPVEANLLAAEAMRFEADYLEKWPQSDPRGR